MDKCRVDQKIAVLIDGNNLEKSIHTEHNSENFMVNYDLLISKLVSTRTLNKLIYFREGTHISEKLAKRLHQNFFGIVRACHKSVDIPLTIEAVQMADKIDTIILMSGDSDYIDLVKYLKGRGLRVEVAAVKHSASQYLISAADSYYELQAEDCFEFKN